MFVGYADNMPGRRSPLRGQNEERGAVGIAGGFAVATAVE